MLRQYVVVDFCGERGIREVGCGAVDEFYFNSSPIKENIYIEKM